MTLTPPKVASTKLLLIIVFLLFLIAPILDASLKIDKTPARNENRALAAAPDVRTAISNIPEFLKNFDTYYADNFGFRRLLIRVAARIKYFGLGISPNDNVLIGKNGWFFPAIQKNVELYRNVHPFTPTELQEYVTKLQQRKAWSESIGARYFYMVGPDSLTINSEHLPDWVTKINPGSRMDQLIEAAREGGVNIIDFRPALASAKAEGDVSYHTDSHWNNYGGYIAYREVVNTIRKEISSVHEPISIEEYELIHESRSGLDLTTIMGLADAIPEVGDELVYRGVRTFDQSEKVGLHFSTKNINAEPFSIAFVCDSMCGNIYPHLARQFRDMRVLWGYLFNTDEIRKTQPQVILDMAIERTLSLTWGQAANPDEVKEISSQHRK